MQRSPHQLLNRRAFLQGTSLVMAGLGTTASAFCEQREEDDQVQLSIALLTDLHYADKAAAGSRFYRDTLDKLDAMAQTLKDSACDLVVELGDLIDAAPEVATELGYLKTINDRFAALGDDRHYVLGNHCVDTLQKSEFLEAVGQSKSFYSFDRQGWHFIILDACFRADGTAYGRRNFEWTDANLADDELQWLEADLQQVTHPTIVFVHQRLDIDNAHGIKNQKQVRELLEQSGLVRAVLQGHSHQNDYRQIQQIHYCTLSAMVEGSGVENNAFARLQLHDSEKLVLQGFHKQQSHTWDA